jgi:hypothetical protein
MPEPIFDLNAVLEATTYNSFIFAGTSELHLLKDSTGERITVDVVAFSYVDAGNGFLEADGSPRRFRYSGKLLGALFNEKITRGKFTFEDGTVVFYDRSILD